MLKTLGRILALYIVLVFFHAIMWAAMIWVALIIIGGVCLIVIVLATTIRRVFYVR